MKMQKKTYETAEITILLLDNDMLITSGGALPEDGWDEFDFSKLN